MVAQAADGESAVALYRRERPDVSLVDLRMPALDGVHVVEQIRRDFPEAVLVVLTTFDTDDDVDRALLTAGAKAYLLKDVSPADLVACVRAVLHLPSRRESNESIGLRVVHSGAAPS